MHAHHPAWLAARVHVHRVHGVRTVPVLQRARAAPGPDDPHDLADLPRVNEVVGLPVERIPAPRVVHAERRAGVFHGANQRVRVLQRRRHGFLTEDHRHVGLNCRDSQRSVRVVGGRDAQDVDALGGQHAVQVVIQRRRLAPRVAKLVQQRPVQVARRNEINALVHVVGGSVRMWRRPSVAAKRLGLSPRANPTQANNSCPIPVLAIHVVPSSHTALRDALTLGQGTTHCVTVATFVGARAIRPA